MLETVAIIGPARFGVPLTQALSAPILGRLHARGAGFWPQLLACAIVRLLHNAATTAFFIWVIAGGLDAYAGTYDAIGRRVGLEVGTADALALTLAGLLGWAAFASTVQVLVYRRGLRAWEPGPTRVRRESGAFSDTDHHSPGAGSIRGRLPLRPLVAFVVLLAQHRVGRCSPPFPAGSRSRGCCRGPDPEPVPAGLVFAAILAAGAFAFALGGGLGLDTALRRAGRAALLVLVATWLRAAAGAAGLREVSRRALGTAAARAVGRRGRRGARRDRGRGPAGGGGPLARRARSRRRRSARSRCSTRCSSG